MKLKIKSVKKSGTNVGFLFGVVFFLVMLFGFNPDVMDSSVVYKNLVIPYININITVVLAMISIVTIAFLILLKAVKLDNCLLLMILRIPFYFIPCIYIAGNFKIGTAYALIQCIFSYYIGLQKENRFDKYIKWLILVSIVIGLQVFSVLWLNHISIFTPDLKWYMVIPMGKSNYISCILFPIYVMVNIYFKNLDKKIFIWIYTIFIFVAILGTGSKGALVLLIGYEVVKYTYTLISTKKIEKKSVIRNIILFSGILILLFIGINMFKNGLTNIALKFITNNIFINRLNVYKDIFSIISEHMIFGRSAYAYQAYDATKAHNYLLESLTQTGVVGTIIFVSLLYCSWIKIKSIYNSKIRKAVCGFFIIFLIQGLYEPNMFGALSDGFLWLTIGIGISSNYYEKRCLQNNQIC